ncbi:chloride channel protein [Actinomyces trachealis]|uniref:chloride channel protein n=1 Tax=Actinomyces trachealis TaxID=2763540 RepID=UPI0018C789A1|nr:chloride channel protein [Actinomyces trachealis]
MRALRAVLLAFFRHHRSGMIVLAVAVGVLSGLAAVAFRLGIDAWTELLSGAKDYTLSMGPSVGLLHATGRWFVIPGLLVSALLVGGLMSLLGHTATGHGVSGVMWSSRNGNGTMRLVPAVATTASSALTIGAGGAVGPEGPISELGAALGSKVGGGLGLPQRWVRVLAAAGTAAGIASAFDTPLAGAFFALEVILLDFTAETFGYVVVACVASTVVSHHLLGISLSLSLPFLNLSDDLELGWVALLGVLGGLFGTLFTRSTVAMRSLVHELWHGPDWALPVAGALPLAGVLLLVPEMYGESGAVLDRALDARYGAMVLLGLLLLKILATSATLALGFQGGVFAPSLFIGGLLGAHLGTLLAPGDPTKVAVFGVLGMGAVFTGSARAPITGVVLIVEMTRQYNLLLPLMLAIALATATSRFLTRTTIYTEELRRRGDDVEDPVASTLMGRTRAWRLMSHPPAVLDELTTLTEATRVLSRCGTDCLPVVAGEARPVPAPPVSPGSGAQASPFRTPHKPADARGLGQLLGCVSATGLAEAALRGGTGRPVASLLLTNEHVDLMADSLEVLTKMLEARLDGLPVTRTRPSGELELVGWITKDSLVRRLYRQQRRALEAAQARSSFGSRIQARWTRRS